ncbi:hypothetical protein BG011_006115 [Mortierella polycephala]|uniref:Uncharacterized protein n=1 Tax=Mortierella polycephala TaxID=41804 RepID=A0A9P6U0H3_9FUNG|nr:hypothetical protein BG011_006115 [Mortierella polycephala]
MCQGRMRFQWCLSGYDMSHRDLDCKLASNSPAVVLAQSSSSEAPYVCDALFARSFFFGKDTSDPSAIDLDVLQHPKNHPTAATPILLNAASFKPEDDVITDPDVFSEFEAPKVSAALQLAEIRKKIESLVRDYPQLAYEASKTYDFSRAVAATTTFRDLIHRFVAKNPWRNFLDHFLERMSSAKDQGRPDDNDKLSTSDGIFKGIQGFFSSIGGIFEGIRDSFAGTAGLLISIPEYIGNFSRIFKSMWRYIQARLYYRGDYHGVRCSHNYVY